jgi:hypothetical protein
MLSEAAISMVIQLEADGPEARLWIAFGWPTSNASMVSRHLSDTKPEIGRFAEAI